MQIKLPLRGAVRQHLFDYLLSRRYDIPASDLIIRTLQGVNCSFDDLGLHRVIYDKKRYYMLTYKGRYISFDYFLKHFCYEDL